MMAIPRQQRAERGTGGAGRLRLVTPLAADLRSPQLKIENIRGVLKPKMSDLAKVFGVSRQAVYKWESGESSPEEDKLELLQRLSNMADQFANSAVSRPDLLMQRKAFDGQSLWDLAQTGKIDLEQVRAVIIEGQRSAKEYVDSGLADSTREKTDDWQSYISIPGEFE